MLLIQPALAQVDLGVIVGVNNSGLNGDAPSKSKYTSNKGVGLGVIGEFKIAKDVKLSLQPMYLKKGATIAVDVPGEKDPKDSLNVDLNYISLPIMVKVVSGNGKTYVTGGFDVGFLQDATLKTIENGEEQDMKDSFQSLDVAVNFGLGIMLPIGKPRLIFELRYAQGVLNISNVEPEEDSLPPQFKTTGFQFFTGLMIPVGNRN
jgi:hypothetical protein